MSGSSKSKTFRAGAVAIAFVGLLLSGVPAAAQDGDSRAPIIAAASDLQFALEEISGAFTENTGRSVRLSMGSSGNFARQIRQGAPFQMYLSADEDYVLNLARDEFTRDEGVLYAVGRIVIIVPEGSPLAPDGSLEDLEAALQDGRVNRFAIANPEHAPYGKRAREALQHRGLWEAVEPHLVLGENVSQAAQFATSANAQGGIIAYSLALAPAVAALGTYELIPDDWHQPLNQRMVLMNDAGPVAQAFYDYVQQPLARSIFRRYGFVLDGEEPLN
jgi:molybdate transport system substrate-binding protein